MIVGFLRGLADFIDSVQRANRQRQVGFADREAGDYLDRTDVGDVYWPLIAIDEWRAERTGHGARIWLP